MNKKILFKENFISSETVRYKEKKSKIIPKLLNKNYKIKFGKNIQIKEIISPGNINKNYLISVSKKNFILKKIKNNNPEEIKSQLKFSNFLLKKKI